MSKWASDAEMVGVKLLEVKSQRLDFARNDHINTHGDRLDFSRFPHIKSLYSSTAPVIVVQGSTQCLKSEWMIVDHLAMAYSGLSLFFVLPKFEHRGTYVQNRINRCVQSVPRYKTVVDAGFFDSVVLKSFGRGVIKYVGSNVLADFREHPADVLYVDEVDECDQGNLMYAIDRLGASLYKFQRYIGNPTLPNKGINALLKKSDGREWNVPCQDCGEVAELDWFRVVVEDVTDDEGTVVSYQLRDSEWEPGCRRDIRCVCPRCGGTLVRDSRDGVWIAARPEVTTSEGYHISKLCATINPIADMWVNFQAAQSDPGLLQHFFTSELGLPFAAVGNRVNEQLLDRCVEDGYNVKIQPDCAFIAADRSKEDCSMGVDVGASFDVRISQPVRGRRRMLFVGKVPPHLDALCELVERYNVQKCVIDSMPETMVSREFQELAGCDVWMCRYRGEGTDRRQTYDLKDRIINVDRTEAMDRAFAQLRRKKNILPENYASILSGQWVKEMCVPVRQIVEDTRGNSRYEWTKGTDHARHADLYDMLAADLMEESLLDGITIA